MAMSKITIFPIEAWEKGWEKQLPKHFRSFWKKPTASSEIVRRLCFCTHSSLSERSKSICEWMATAWCPKKHSDRPTCDRNKYSRMTNMCSSPYVSMFSPNLWKRTTVIQSILPMGLAWLATPLIFSTWLHRWHLNITLASWTYLRPSSVGLELLSSPQTAPQSVGTNGVPMGPGRLLWYVASHLANFPVQPWRPNSSKDNQCSKVPSGNDCYSSLLKMVKEKLIYPWIAWWIFPYVAVYQAGYPSNFYRIQGSRPADGHPLRQRRTPRPSDHKMGKWYGEEMRISLHLVKLTNVN